MKQLISFILVLSASTAFSSIGTVLFTIKNVVAENGGVRHALTRGSVLNVNDVILTAADASAKIKYLNGTLVTIGPSSSYKIVAYSPTQTETLKAELTKGKIESQTHGGTKKEALKTPIVALAITGTTYRVYVADAKNTNVQLIDGQITLGGKVLQPGESVLATKNRVVAAPFPAVGTIKLPSYMLSIPSNISSSNPASTIVDIAAQINGAETVSYVTSAIIAATASASNISAAEQQASFSIQCFPTGLPLN
jgi:hypothetical protein